jgi:uncharacterized protein
MQIGKNNSPAIPWIEIAVFYSLAVGISAPFRLKWINMAELVPLPGGGNLFYSILKAAGPICAYFIVFYLLRSKVSRKLTLVGHLPIGSIASLAVLPLCFTALGMHNNAGLNPHLFGLMYGLMLSAYALCEEYGWRGYLQSALQPLPEWPRICIIGTMWFVWHLNFFRHGMSIEANLLQFAAILLGTWGLLRSTETTHSLLVAAGIHLSFNLFVDAPWPLENKLLTLALAIPIWVWTIQKSVKKNKTPNRTR